MKIRNEQMLNPPMLQMKQNLDNLKILIDNYINVYTNAQKNKRTIINK